MKAPRSAFQLENDASRLLMLDVVRGFAVLGILVMNIQSFGMISSAYSNPTATVQLTEQLTGANYWVWYVGNVFFDAKFMTLFSVLFGAGILLMSQRCEASGRNPATTHYRRLAGLLMIGLIHGYVFWFGDILVPYAICGAVIYPFWRFRNRTRLVAAACLFLVGSLLTIAAGLSMPFWSESELTATRIEIWEPTQQMVDDEIRVYRGPWLAQFADRTLVTFEVQTFGLAFLLFWQISALMLIGMTLLDTGVLTGEASRRVYTVMLLIGFGIGLPVVILGTRINEQRDWEMTYSMLIGMQPNYFGSLLVAIGYIGTWGLLLKSHVGRSLGRFLSPVGRMALTNYLMQTLIGTTIFYGHGFGLFMTLQRTQQAVIVCAIWCFQIAFSHWWLNRYQFGPAEYAWRMVTYARRPTKRI